MNMRILHATIACGLIYLLSACGGGGGGSTTLSGTVDFSAVISKYGIGRSGVGGDSKGNAGAAGGAGDGAPLVNATVTLTDATGNIVTGNTDSNGKYLLLYQTSIFKAPLVLRVVDAGGNVLASVAENVSAVGTADITNVNPLTDKIVSDILSSAIAGTDKNFDGSALNVALIATAKTNLATSLNAALVAAGITDPSTFDPIRSSYVYDGTGIDAVIESISHSRNPSTGATEM
ncbi:MAG: hypothetical protein HXX19_13890, partial [Rhodoferax sp.]|nr:hypothetical protein [Rhodoferax sp.]